MKIFASIYIGSNDVLMKVYEISRSKGVREVDRLRKAIPILRDIYDDNRISRETTQELIRLIGDMKNTIDAYRCDAYRCYASDIWRQAVNHTFVMDQIRLTTGVEVTILSNSEHRFLSYQAFASTDKFEDLVAQSMVLIDVSGGSLQLTLFDAGSILTTQHIMIGISTIAEQLMKLSNRSDGRRQVKEMIDKELERFATMYLKGRRPKYLAILGEHSYLMIRHLGENADQAEISMKEYQNLLNGIDGSKLQKVADQAGYLGESRGLFEAFLLLHKAIVDTIPAEILLVPGVSVNEGMAYYYACSNKVLKASHDFDEDVMSAAWFIARRYGCYEPHLRALERMTSDLFDVMKKYHGLEKRCRLLLRVSAVLHDCGKYVSLAESAEASQMIIMDSEILGLTHREREMVAEIVRLNRQNGPIDEEELEERFTSEEYLVITKLLVLLRMANTLDRSHKQKFTSMKMYIRDRQLNIVIEVSDSIALEKGMFAQRAREFEEVFAIRPVIREHRVL